MCLHFCLSKLQDGVLTKEEIREVTASVSTVVINKRDSRE